MAEHLFEEFDAVSAAQWKQQIQVDLKGADYNDTLITHTPEGIDIKPFYHREDSPAHQIPFTATATGDWYISQKIFAYNAEAANKKTLNALERGAEGMILVIPHKEIDLNVLFKDLPDAGIQVHLEFLDLAFAKAVQNKKPKAYVHVDPIAQLAKTGNWFSSRNEDLKTWTELVKNYQGYFSNITVASSVYQEAGATIVQELAYYLSHLNEYLTVLDEEGLIKLFDQNQEQPKRVNIDAVSGGNYFLEIAKFRAYRVLTKSLGNEYGIDLGCYISASPTLRDKSLLDYNVNMLRTTTQCMSAILGGADTLYNLPYDVFFNKPNEFGERISRNQLLILKEEAYFNKIGNPAEGAYYIETLTEQLVIKALEVFKQIEKGGGFISALHEGTIQRKIKESAQQEQKDLESGKKVLVGATKYPNDAQPLQKEYEILPFVKKEARKTLIQPIIQKRLTEDLEKKHMREL